MKAKKVLLPLALLLLIGTGTFLFFFGGPYRFVDRSLYDQSLQRLRSSAGSAPWAASPSETAFEYLYGGVGVERPNRTKVHIAVSYCSPDESIVTVIDNDCRDDSTWRTCDRLTLRRQSGAWLPVRHQVAWQGRGRLGWTTEPTL